MSSEYSTETEVAVPLAPAVPPVLGSHSATAEFFIIHALVQIHHLLRLSGRVALVLLLMMNHLDIQRRDMRASRLLTASHRCARSPYPLRINASFFPIK